MLSSAALETGEVLIVYWLLVLMITFILDLITSLGHTHREKDLEIIILRQQVRI
jgi:hypothetical protein